MNARLTEFADRRERDLSGFTLDRLSFDYATSFLIAIPHSSLTVIIETPFTLQTSSHVETIDPKRIVSAERLLKLSHHPVASLTAFRSGQLFVMFEDGTKIQVPKNEQYESWQTYGDGETADMGMLCSGHEGSLLIG